MPIDPAPFDFFVSYARADNTTDWITRFIEALQEEHRAFSGGRAFKVFFDKDDIHSLDDWRLRIYDSLAASHLFLAFVSPAYFASEWCRREWRTWIDVEIAKHVLSDGAAPIYIVEVPWLGQKMTEPQVAQAIAQLTQRVPADLPPGLAADAMQVTGEISQRQLTMAQPFYTQGLDALRRQDLRKVLATLAKDLEDRAQHVTDAAKSQSTIPPYNRRFVGRQDELLKLRERLFQGRTGVISGHKVGTLAEIASVQGLGGIGKTELAFTYAHAFAGLYPGGRFLIQCEHLTDLRLALLQLDSLFPGAATDEQRKSLELHFGAIRAALRQRLGHVGRILLVLDNVSNLALLAPEQTDLIRILGPQLHLLATTRLGAPEGQNTGSDIHWLTIGQLTFEDSLRLLEKHRPFIHAERIAAETIARRLDGFALCVEVVGAYLGQHPEESYASFLAKMGLADLEPVDSAAGRKETVTRRHNNEKRLGAILALTLAKLTAMERSALDFASLLAPDHVVLPWLLDLTAGTHPEIIGAGETWRKIEHRLLSLALLARGNDEQGDVRVVRTHRLVQAFVRKNLGATASLAAPQQALDAFVTQRDALLKKTTRWQDARWEIEPLEALANLWADNSHKQAAWLLNQVGQRWHHLAKWNRAEPLMKRALVIDETSYGKNHPKVAIRLNNLAGLLQATNRLAEAETLYKRALAIDEASYGKDHPNVARDLNNLATLLQATNRHADAEPLYKRALAIDEASYGKDHPEVARDLNNLATLLKDTNRLAEAEPLLRRALEIDEHSFGKDHPNVARDLNNLATLLQATNRLAEAEPLMRRALEIDEHSFGKDHPNVARDLNNLATLLQATNRLAEAEPLMRRALAIDENSYSKDHPNVARDLNNLAGLLQATNRLAEAETLYKRALAIDEASYGKDHPEVARDLNNLAGLLQATNRLAEAEPLPRRALEIDEHSFGKDHPNVARDLNNLATLLQATNRHADAEPLMKRALAIDEASYGKDHPNVAKDLNNLAQLLQATNRLVEAEPLMKRALAIWENSLGVNHPNVATALNNLAQLLQDTNRHADAEPLYKRALAIDEASYGKDHPNVAKDLNNLAQLLQATNRLVEAEPLMKRALAIWENSLGVNHPNVATALNNLAQLLQDTNRHADAEPLYKRALAIDEASYGKNHPNVARDLNNLAQLLKATNRLVEAEPLMKRALAIWENSLGVNHPNVATALNNLAQLLQDTNRLAETEPLYKRALAIDENSYGKDQPEVARDLNNLALLFQATNRLAEAEPLLRRVVGIFENSLGENHPNVATALNNLAQLLQDTNRLAEAEPLMKRHLEIFLKFTRTTGHPHPHLQGAVNNYAGLLQAMGQTHEQILATMRELAPEIFATGAAGESPQDQPTLQQARGLALELYKRGDYAKAAELLQLLLDAGFEIVSTHLHLARIVLITGDLPQAREHVAQAWGGHKGTATYIVARIVWLQLALAILDSVPTAPILGRLKTALQSPDAHMEWAMDPVLEHLKPALPEQKYKLLSALVAALSDAGNMAALEQFPEWRDQPAIPLDDPP